MHIAVIGTGYVGLVTGACFAEFGVTVTCVDNDKEKISLLNSGRIPIYEPGLDAMVAKNVRQGRLSFTNDVRRAVEDSLVIFLAVGTPQAGDGSADMSQIERVALDIARSLNGYKVVVTKSTVPVGAAALIKRLIEENRATHSKFSVAANPEFLREGAAINDFMRPDRVVIGCTDDEAIAILKEIYRPLFLIETPFVITTPESAEMIKYASNAFLATKISFINEIANLCEALGADVHDVAKGMGMDNRIGSKFLHPGPGFGGSCFPKDAKALVALGRDANCRVKIVEAALEVNDLQRSTMVDRVRRLVPELKDKVVAVLGLSFKPETDDLREAPSLKLIADLLEAGARVRAYDPVSTRLAAATVKGVEFAEDEYDAAAGSDALAIVTEWNQFRSLDLQRIRQLMRDPNLIDLRNVYEPESVRSSGFNYVGMGRL
jgi:UDPglucose 6-dehydrogenase